MKATTKKALYPADIYKLEVGDTIFYSGKKHTIVDFFYSSQGMINSITTTTHHLCGFDIFTSDITKSL